MNRFYIKQDKLNDNLINDSDLNHQILLFLASFHYEPFKVAQHEENENLPLSCLDTTIEKFLENL